jgi:hypothetical protein
VKRDSTNFDPLCTGKLRLARTVVIRNQWRPLGHEAHFSGCSAFDPDHHSALSVLALAMPRTQIEPRKGDKRYVLRKKGKFTKSQDDAHLLQIAASARSEFEARRR